MQREGGGGGKTGGLDVGREMWKLCLGPGPSCPSFVCPLVYLGQVITLSRSMAGPEGTQPQRQIETQSKRQERHRARKSR